MRIAVIPVLIVDVSSAREADEFGEEARKCLAPLEGKNSRVETVVTLALDAQGVIANLLREALRRQGKE